MDEGERMNLLLRTATGALAIIDRPSAEPPPEAVVLETPSFAYTLMSEYPHLLPPTSRLFKQTAWEGDIAFYEESA
jgi:hypothetical protein